MNTRSPFNYHGADSDFMYWTTPSWSRRKGVEHNIAVCKRTGVISCNCEDATYRKKKGDVLDTTAKHTCKHVRYLLTLFAVVLPKPTEEIDGKVS